MYVFEGGEMIKFREQLAEELRNQAHWAKVGPELLDALKYAYKLIPIARQFFPKSIRNSDTFQLENTCAMVGKAISKAEAPHD